MSCKNNRGCIEPAYLARVKKETHNFGASSQCAKFLFCSRW